MFIIYFSMPLVTLFPLQLHAKLCRFGYELEYEIYLYISKNKKKNLIGLF